MTLIDLSLPLSSGMQVYPGDVETSIRPLDSPAIMNAGWTAHNVAMSLHAGTHIEAPAHSISGGKRIEDYPLEIFRGKAATIGWQDVGRCEVRAPILLLHSGADRWFGEERYLTPTTLTQWEAEWIGEQGIRILGLDILTVGDINIHRLIQIKDVLIVEGMCNLDRLLHRDAVVSLFPVSFKGVEASPVRAVGEVKE